MEHCIYNDLKIYSSNESREYMIEQDEKIIGYLFTPCPDFATGKPEWLGSNDNLMLVAAEIGKHLETQGLEIIYQTFDSGKFSL